MGFATKNGNGYARPGWSALFFVTFPAGCVDVSGPDGFGMELPVVAGENGGSSREKAIALPGPLNALTCVMDADCASGFCADGVCCDSACTGTCEACTTAKKGSGVDGTCGPIKFDTDPDDECVDSGCDGKGTCKLYNGAPCPNGDECLSYCVDGVCCGNVCTGTCQSCSAAKKGYGFDGVCEPITAGTDPDGECGAGACTAAGTCASGLPGGSACMANGDCALGFCVDGVCCDSACSGTCEACTSLQKGSGVDGVCGPIKFDTDPDEECVDSGCDGKGTCKLYNGAPCPNGDECLSYCVDGVCCGNVCTGTCQSCSAAEKGYGYDGVCEPIAAGTDPDQECTQPNTCNGAGQCGLPGATCTMNTWIDLTGLGHDGHLMNFGSGSWVGDGTPANPYALAFDGIDDFVNVLPTADGLRFAEELSVEVWAIPEVSASYYSGLFGARTKDSYNGYILAQCHTDGIVPHPNSWGWYACPTGNCPYWADTYSDTSASIATQWYHVAGTYSLTEGIQRLYVNGVKQNDEHAIAAPILYANDMELLVGNAVTGTTSFQGRIAIVRVWSRALSGVEVADLFAKDANRFGLSAPNAANPVTNSGLALHYEAGPCLP